MIKHGRVGLRARHSGDVGVLHAELYDDVAVRARADNRPWVPMAADSADAIHAVRPGTEAFAPFSVVELESGELAGEAVLWGVDTHNRSAHLGISLRPAFRGKGLAVDVIRALCEYGFAVRGLHRLQLETMADNAPMLATARRAGFTPEGTLRQAAWVYGRFSDEVILGLLAADWTPTRPD